MRGGFAMITRKLVGMLAVLALAMSSLGALAIPASADSAPPISVGDVTAMRPSSGTAGFTFTVTLEYASNNTVNVNYFTSDGSAISTFDYQQTFGVLSFAPGQLTKTVKVLVNGTTLHTGDRYFNLNLNNPVNGFVSHSQGVGLIQDPTPNTYVNVSDATVVQGDGAANTANFTVSLTQANANNVRVHYTTADNSARAGIDYTRTAGNLTIPAGNTSATVGVPVLATSTYSATRNFNLNLSGSVNATLDRNSGTGTILNDNHIAYVTVDDVTVKRPNSGTATVNVPIRLTAAASFDVTVNYSTSDNSATTVAGDYVANSGSVTISAGSTQVTVPVTVNSSGGTANKNFFLNIASASPGASIFRPSGIETIVGTGAYSQFVVNDTSTVAPTSGNKTMNITITLSPASASATTVHWATADGSALGGTNYTPNSGTASFAAGVTSQTVPITVTASNTTFTDGYMVLNLSAPTGGAVLERSQGAAYIQTHDIVSQLSIVPIAVQPPTSGTTTAMWTVTLTPPSLNTVTVHWATADGTALGGTDYTATSGNLTFNPTQTSKTFSVPVLANTTNFGADRYFYVNLSAPTNAALQNNQAYTRLLNTNKAPTLSVNNTAVYKPLTGKTTASLNVTLSSASVNTVTVHYTTADNSATAGVDYTATNGTLTFAPGVVTNKISLSVLGGTVTTGNRSFFVNLSAPTNATISSNSGLVNIIDDTIVPYLSLNGTAVVRPASGTVNDVFTATLSSPSANAVTAHYTTSDNSATSGIDYTTTTGTVTFAPGVTSQHINVPVLARTVKTGDKSFFLTLSTPVNALVSGQSQDLGYILDTNFNPGISVNDVSKNRPTSGSTNETFAVTLSPASANTVTVNYATSDGNAVAGTDYTATSGMLTFAPGVTSQNVNVSVTGINASTPNRFFNLNLSAATNSQLLRSNAVGWIINTVVPVAGVQYLSAGDGSLVKPASGTANESFTINLLAAPTATAPVTVSYTTADSSAVAGIDYKFTRGSVTFNVGQTSKTVNVPIIGNTLASADKVFNLNLFSPAPSPGTQFARSQGTGLIIENQPSNRVFAGNDAAVIKGDSGTQTMHFTVNLSSAQSFPVQVDYFTSQGSALDPSNYLGDSGTLTFAPGTTSIDVPITVNSNTFILPTEYFQLNLTNPQGTVVGSTPAYGFIYNADVFNITGSIVGPTGSPVSGATVTRTGNNQPTVHATTAADGTFKIPNTLGGKYTLTPSHGGKIYLPATTSVIILGGDVGGQNFLEYTAGPSTVIGQVAGPKAVGGVTITRTGGGQATALATTTSLGYFAFGGLPNGTAYVFTPTLASWTFAPTSYTVNIDGVATVASLDFVGVQAGSITGRVTHAGAGVAGVTVTSTASGQPAATATTNSQGYYGFTKLKTSAGGITYTLTPTLSGHTFTPTSLSATLTTATTAISGKNFVEN
jgi:hypothetical protein